MREGGRKSAYNFSFPVVLSAAVGRREGGRTFLQVPWLRPKLRAAADAQRVDAVGVSIAAARIRHTPPVTRCPDVDRTLAPSTLKCNHQQQHYHHHRHHRHCYQFIVCFSQSYTSNFINCCNYNITLYTTVLN